MGRTASSTTTTRSPVPHNSGMGLAFIIFGLILLFFALLITTLQIQTNEAYLQGNSQKDETFTGNDWSVWCQLPKMASSGACGPDIKSDEIPSIIISQGVEIIYIIIISAAGVIAARNKKMTPLLSFIGLVGLLIICIFDSYSDYKFGNIPEWEHWLFAAFCAFVIGFFPKWAIGLIREGWRHL